MSTRLSLRIQERIAKLTKSEQKLAAVILEQPSLIETHTATELAVMADVSKATAARFFRTLGYSDFEEVKLQAREERNRTQPYSHTAGAQTGAALGRKISEHLELELANITRTFEEMRADALRDVARILVDAPRLWLCGFGSDAWLSRYGRTLFARLRPDVHILGPMDGALAEDLAMMGPRDAMLVFCQGRQPKELKAVLSFAKTTRVQVVALADRSNLPTVKRFATSALYCHVSSYGLVPSSTTLVSILRLLAITFAGLSGDSASRRAALIDDIHEELDVLQ